MLILADAWPGSTQTETAGGSLLPSRYAPDRIDIAWHPQHITGRGTTLDQPAERIRSLPPALT